ncbi:MAG TPA: GDCCVxC domain-containing (seleno)protein [Hyphomicrobiaceae bacterium]|nr:GDCCVxC domain-containing (seleno)protein [Hyphomicrobiaceae bacterium]
MELQSVICCPMCGHRAVEIMPTDTCQIAYDCKHCGYRMKAIKGRCCVYCCYGTVPCPPAQRARNNAS